MKFYSTNNKNNIASLKEAVIRGLPEDNGLFMPCDIPKLETKFINNLSNLTYHEIGYEVISALFKDDLTKSEIIQLVDHTLTFDTPNVLIKENLFALELFHGPTLAFKDIGARFSSMLMRILLKNDTRPVKVLVATSGDTGSAVANGFFNIEGIEVMILYPKNKVSPLQEKQFTTLGNNIRAIEVDGTFDDCQRLVKEAFLDKDVSRKHLLTSANSINVARWLPQCLYYFRSYSDLNQSNLKIAYAVPSGNFGNLAAGVLSYKMGLPINKFIAATNINKVVPTFLNGGKFSPMRSISTISNSMDVGNPSNFPRLLNLYSSEDSLRQHIEGSYFTDEKTKQAIKEVYSKLKYTLDPHGAVAYLALDEFLKGNKDYQGVFLETAHPAKFKEVIEEVLEKKIEIPERLLKFESGVKVTTPISNKFLDFKELLSS